MSNINLHDCFNTIIDKSDPINTCDLEKINLPKSLLGSEELLLYHAVDRTMIKAGINYNDLVIIDPLSTVENDDIVALKWDNNERTILRRIMLQNDTICFVSENDKMDTFEVPSTDWSRITLLGKAIAVIKQVR